MWAPECSARDSSGFRANNNLVHMDRQLGSMHARCPAGFNSSKLLSDSEATRVPAEHPTAFHRPAWKIKTYTPLSFSQRLSRYQHFHKNSTVLANRPHEL